ncbi:MAG: hypothetical protein ACM3PE_03150 [Deltaproteobacteria bacterium]
MAIRKSIEETIVVSGNREERFLTCVEALKKAGFKNISPNNVIFQIEGSYKKATVWGEILITLLPEGPDTRIVMKSTANVDNIYALFKSPTKTIIDKFKEQLS